MLNLGTVPSLASEHQCRHASPAVIADRFKLRHIVSAPHDRASASVSADVIANHLNPEISIAHDATGEINSSVESGVVNELVDQDFRSIGDVKCRRIGQDLRGAEGDVRVCQHDATGYGQGHWSLECPTGGLGNTEGCAVVDDIRACLSVDNCGTRAVFMGQRDGSQNAQRPPSEIDLSSQSSYPSPFSVIRKSPFWPRACKRKFRKTVLQKLSMTRTLLRRLFLCA